MSNNNIVYESGNGVMKCTDCKERMKSFEIMRILQWRGYDNYLTALGFDRETNQILVNKDSLMRAIQMANPGQAYRDIRLVTNEEFRELNKRESDYSSWDEKVRKEKEVEEEHCLYKGNLHIGSSKSRYKLCNKINDLRQTIFKAVFHV